jgi:hypothetical protein
MAFLNIYTLYLYHVIIYISTNLITQTQCKIYWLLPKSKCIINRIEVKNKKKVENADFCSTEEPTC